MWRLPLLLVGLALLVACAGADPVGAPIADAPDAVPSAPSPVPTTPLPTTPPPADVPVTPSPTATAAPQASAAATPAPAWLGTRVLPRRPDGFGEVQPTPDELVDRRIATVDVLDPPAGDAFASSVALVPDDVLTRSTWSPKCPVGRDDLRYVTVAFWGFDERPHTGELLVHADAAADVIGIFRELHAARFPIEEMRITTAAELELPPTGDGNNTGAFVCRPSRGGAGWSQHAYGLAVDVNPFHNPYVRGDLVLPELASAYVERDAGRPGLVLPGGVVAEAFAAIGWRWGGDWQRSKDWMHFSRDGT